jgi:hypothetical protein
MAQADLGSTREVAKVERVLQPHDVILLRLKKACADNGMPRSSGDRDGHEDRLITSQCPVPSQEADILPPSP